MRIDFTPIVRPYFTRIAKRVDYWKGNTERIQRDLLTSHLKRASQTEIGKKYGFAEIANCKDPYKEFSKKVPTVHYEDIREDVMKMIKGKKDILWPGVCRNFAQSSGTSGGKSKYLPITDDSLKGNHYRGGEDAVAHYLNNNPKSHMFAGKGFILGGSFSNTLNIPAGTIHIGDLSATLINHITPLAELVRVPSKKTALLSDWNQKLPALVEEASKEYVTNISGVPSWFLTVLRHILDNKKATSLKDVWPGLEVFFHGGISFEPYRDEYLEITKGLDMHFLETYNASEGFFAVQNNPDDKGMLLIIDRDVFYEFIPVTEPDSDPIPVWEVKPDHTYEMVITSSNGLWRYRLGDTVRISSINPVKIRIAGRTGAFINAFGEELMEDNAERAIAAACHIHNSNILNYTAAPVYAKRNKKGRHQWLIEWDKQPSDIKAFIVTLDDELRKLNSDYDAKRSGNIFLEMPEIVNARKGVFDDWLKTKGSHKLGGQRKVPRLSNSREMMENLLELNKE
ncbi:MAG: GH3 auxin-responsive promoter family protein [Muribaculaceae bacterium]|nr:GH3 auxin-responsive promoter family protein [Muribaculaceae bacterium]